MHRCAMISLFFLENMKLNETIGDHCVQVRHLEHHQESLLFPLLPAPFDSRQRKETWLPNQWIES